MIKWEYRVEITEVKGIVDRNMDEMTSQWLNGIGNEGCEHYFSTYRDWGDFS